MSGGGTMDRGMAQTEHGRAGLPWWFPLAVALVLGFFMQGSRGLYESTEGRYSECAREMVASGDLMVPVLNGEPHWTKPPLTYWAIAAGTFALGNTAWGVRLYLVVAFGLTVLAVHCLEGAIRGKPATGYAALLYATAPYTVGGANIASTDTLLTLWEAWAMAFFWLAHRDGRRRFVILMWASLGLAFATKGPVGLFPLIGIVPANRLLWRRSQGKVRLWDPYGAAVFALLGLSWYAYVVVRNPALLRGWFMEELVGRTVLDAHARLSSKPHKLLSVYLPILLLGAGVWVPFVWYRGRKYLHRGLLRRLVSSQRDGAAWLFLMLAVAVPTAIFSASSSRLPLYLLPVFPPMAVAIAWALVRLQTRHRTILRLALGTAVVVAGAKAVAAHKSSWKDMTELAEAAESVPPDGGEHPRVALFRTPLNGLSFHLDETVPVLYAGGSASQGELKRQIEETGGLVPLRAVANGEKLALRQRKGRACFALPRGSDIIVRRKDVRNFGPLLDEERWQVVGETRHWQILRLRLPLEVLSDSAA